MEFRIQKEELLQATGRAQAISEKHRSMQILSHLLLESSNGGLDVQATDLEIGFKGTIEAQIEKPGRISLPAKTLHSIVRELDSYEIHFQEQDNLRVFIKGNRAQYHLAGLPPDEYPSLPQHDDTPLIGVDPAEFKEMLDRTIIAMATEEGRYNLAGVFLEKQDSGDLRIVSTDGHRLTLVDRQFSRVDDLDLEKGAIIPRKGVLEMSRLLGEHGEAEFGIKGTSAVLRAGRSTLMMRLLEARYPDYRQVIPPANAQINFTIKRPELLETLRRMNILTSDKYRGVKVSVDSEALTIVLQNPEVGEAKEKVEIGYEGDPIEVGFNIHYLCDALKVMVSEEVTFSLTEPHRPVKITGPADEDFVAVVMPMAV